MTVESKAVAVVTLLMVWKLIEGPQSRKTKRSAMYKGRHTQVDLSHATQMNTGKSSVNHQYINDFTRIH